MSATAAAWLLFVTAMLAGLGLTVWHFAQAALVGVGA